MGKILIIQGADFSNNALDVVTPTNPVRLWDSVNNEVKKYASSLGVYEDLKNLVNSSTQVIVNMLNGWKESIHSLVNTGKTPWINNNGTAYFDTQYIPSNNSGAKIVFMSKGKTSDAIYYGSRALSGNYRYWLNLSSGTIAEFSVGNSESIETGIKHTVQFNESHVIQMNFLNDNKRYFDGKYYADITPNLSKYKHAGIFCGYDADDSVIGIPNGSLSRVQLTEGHKIVRDYIPYYKDGKYCMVDIIDGSVYHDATNSNGFTYTLL